MPAPPDFIFEVLPGDQRGVELLASGGDFNPKSLLLWRQLLAEGDWTHIVDVGANYGEMLIHPAMPAGAQLIGFEPNPAVRDCLSRNLARAGIAAEISPAAVSDAVGEATLMLDEGWTGMSLLAGIGAPREGLKPLRVPATTLEAALGGAAAAPSMRLALKVDVEGHELAVLRGLGSMLDRFAGFAAMIEIFHLPHDHLAWLAAHFDISMLLLSDHRMTPVPDFGDTFGALLNGDRFYAQDAVIRRRAQA